MWLDDAAVSAFAQSVRDYPGQLTTLDGIMLSSHDLEHRAVHGCTSMTCMGVGNATLLDAYRQRWRDDLRLHWIGACVAVARRFEAAAHG